jgi:hypothetical protein
MHRRDLIARKQAVREIDGVSLNAGYLVGGRSKCNHDLHAAAPLRLRSLFHS